MAKRFFKAVEELEVDKLHREQIESNQNGEFDSLYQNVKQDIEAKKDDQTNKEDVNQPIKGEDDLSTESPEASETNDANTDDVGTATESFLKYHISSNISQESVMETIQDKTIDGLGYLKDLGFEYGSVLMKHIYKGVLVALNKSVKAIVQGAVSIAKYIDKTINSYSNLKKDLENVEKTLDLLEDKEIDASFTKVAIINQLKIKDSYDFKKNIVVAQKFFEDFFNGFENNVRSNIGVTRNIVLSVLHDRALIPSKITEDNVNFNNFVQKTVDGYVPTSEYVNTYVYKYILPGDLVFLGWLPKQDINEHNDIIESFNNSKMMFGINTDSSNVNDSVEYMSISDLKEMVATLKDICDYGMKLDDTYKNVIKDRNALRGILNVYMRFLLHAKDKVSIKESLSDLIMLKIAFTDRTNISGSMYVNDYMTRLVTSSLSYLKEAIKIYS